MIKIKELFSTRKTKEELLQFVNTTPNGFENVLNFALQNNEENTWRAAWVICHAMHKNDERVQPHSQNILDNIDGKTDGHQRQLLIILEKMSFNENQEGFLFDTCLTIWEDIQKIPSTRITAFKILVKIAKKHPELLNELELWTQEYYIDTLSAGIKNSLFRMKKELLQLQKI